MNYEPLKRLLKKALQDRHITINEYIQINDLLDSGNPTDNEKGMDFFDRLEARLDTFEEIEQGKRHQKLRNELTDIDGINFN